MTIRRFATCMIAFVLMSVCSLRALAQNGHSHPQTTQPTAEQKSQAAELLRIVRESTERFKDVAVAEKEGYHLLFGCVSGPDAGAMGLHYVNQSILATNAIDVTRPQIVIYEPTGDGHLKLIGADYLVFADGWDATHQDAPMLMGQIFHLFEAPNRFRLPAFYTLHVWAWKENPNGAFVNWHPNVSCESFVGQTTP